LVNFETIVVFTRADLERHGIDVIGTFRTPHVALAGHDIPRLLAGLVSGPQPGAAQPAP